MKDCVFVPGAQVDYAVPILCLAKRVTGWNVVLALWVIMDMHSL
jgi:hypothetical protein